MEPINKNLSGHAFGWQALKYLESNLLPSQAGNWIHNTVAGFKPGTLICSMGIWSDLIPLHHNTCLHGLTIFTKKLSTIIFYKKLFIHLFTYLLYKSELQGKRKRYRYREHPPVNVTFSRWLQSQIGPAEAKVGVARTQTHSHFILLSQEQLEHKQAPLWDVSIIGDFFTCYVTTLSICTFDLWAQHNILQYLYMRHTEQSRVMDGFTFFEIFLLLMLYIQVILN